MDPTIVQHMTVVEWSNENFAGTNFRKYPYSFENAANTALGSDLRIFERDNNTVILWDMGCRVGSTWNCTAACLDPRIGQHMLWNGNNAMLTLQNCLVYPILATAAAEGWLVEDPPGLLEKYDIIANYTLPTKPHVAAANSAYAWPLINACTQRFCTSVYANATYNGCTLDDSRWQTNYAVGPVTALWTPYLVRCSCETEYVQSSCYS